MIVSSRTELVSYILPQFLKINYLRKKTRMLERAVVYWSTLEGSAGGEAKTRPGRDRGYLK